MSEYTFAELLIAGFILLYGALLAALWIHLGWATWRDEIRPRIRANGELRRLRRWRAGA